MKRAIVGIVTAAMVLSVGVTSAFAAGRGCGRGYGQNFANASGGVCGNFRAICNFVDEDYDGVCDNCDRNHGNCLPQNDSGQNYVDVNSDGVCDNYQGYGHGRGRGCGYRGGCNR